MNDYRKNITLYWRQYYPDWKIPKEYHVHHIKPKCTFEDQNDPRIHHPSNLIALHPDDHVSIHRCRGDIRIAKSGFMNMRGYTHSAETRAKISNANKGHKGWNDGIPCTLETKEKISKTLQGRTFSDETREKMSRWQKGKTVSEQTRLKISKSKKGKIANRNGYTHSEETKAKMAKAKLGKKRKPITEETRLKMSLAQKKRFTKE